MKTPSLAVGFKSENAKLREENRQVRESWDKCKRECARLEAERDQYRSALASLADRLNCPVGWKQFLQDTLDYIVMQFDIRNGLLREVLERNTPSLDLRERIKQAVGETQNAETQNH